MPKGRTFTDMQLQRDRLLGCGAATDPNTLVKGDPFYVIAFTVSDGVCIRRSGVFISRETEDSTTYVTVHLDGDAEPRRMSTNEVGFFPLRRTMVVIVRRLWEITHHLGKDFIETDERSDDARAAEIARTPCSCGTVCGDGSYCSEWPGCTDQ